MSSFDFLVRYGERQSHGVQLIVGRPTLIHCRPVRPSALQASVESKELQSLSDSKQVARSWNGPSA